MLGLLCAEDMRERGVNQQFETDAQMKSPHSLTVRAARLWLAFVQSFTKTGQLRPAVTQVQIVIDTNGLQQFSITAERT